MSPLKAYFVEWCCHYIYMSTENKKEGAEDFSEALLVLLQFNNKEHNLEQLISSPLVGEKKEERRVKSQRSNGLGILRRKNRKNCWEQSNLTGLTQRSPTQIVLGLQQLVSCHKRATSKTVQYF